MVSDKALLEFMYDEALSDASPRLGFGNGANTDGHCDRPTNREYIARLKPGQGLQESGLCHAVTQRAITAYLNAGGEALSLPSAKTTLRGAHQPTNAASESRQWYMEGNRLGQSERTGERSTILTDDKAPVHPQLRHRHACHALIQSSPMGRAAHIRQELLKTKASARQRSAARRAVIRHARAPWTAIEHLTHIPVW